MSDVLCDVGFANFVDREVHPSFTEVTPPSFIIECRMACSFLCKALWPLPGSMLTIGWLQRHPVSCLSIQSISPQEEPCLGRADQEMLLLEPGDFPILTGVVHT